MQPGVAFLDPPIGLARAQMDAGRAAIMRRPRPNLCSKAVMVQSYISKSLTITSLDWGQVCLRQGCTLLATYKCTLGQVWGLRTEGEKLASEWISGGP